MVKVSSKEINDFLLPVPSLKEQKRIVEKIKAEIELQDFILDKVKAKRDEIEEVMVKLLE